MPSGYEVVDEGHVGGREQVESEWKTIRAVFHDFASLPSKRGEMTSSPDLECHGMKWNIQVYPGGDYNSSEEEVFVSLYLYCLSSSREEKIRTRFNIRIPSKGSTLPLPWTTFFDRGLGRTNYSLRFDALDLSKNYLVRGNLTVEVDIRVMLDKPPTWTPSNTVCSDMLKLLEPEHDDDFGITFQVGEDGTKQFHAHLNILKVRAPVLADFVADYPDSSTVVPIKDVEPDVFRMLLRFIYGGEIPSDEFLGDQAKPIIHAADKYGCTGLKLAAESKMAAAGITTENVAELILFADAANCAMLKEAAMEYFAANADDVMSSEGYKQVAESPAIMGEMVAAVVASNKKRSAGSPDDDGRDYKRMRVATLRQKLDEKKLDVDGSKEMLISRLESYDAEAEAAAQAEAENNNEGEESVNDVVEVE